MDTLLRIGLSNAAVATVLALGVAAVTRTVRPRPALVHSLWLLVLLKLLAPPLFGVPIPWPAKSESPGTAAVSPQSGDAIPGPAAPIDSAAQSAVLREDDPGFAVPLPQSPERVPTFLLAAVSWQAIVAGFWLAGSCLWWLIAGVRLLRFRQLLRCARPAPPALQERAEHLARRLGLARSAGVWLVPAAISPLLWALGRPRLLLPAALWERLSEVQRDTLLVHELAHLRRRDHWVRWLEVAALGLYWWHPVVWCARRELQEAEEQCCDAWVVWALPEAGPAYAEALLETVTSLSRPVRLLAASGMGQLTPMKRRFAMILHGTMPRALPRGGVWAVLMMGALTLPLLPVRSQPEPQKLDQQTEKISKPQDKETGKAEAPRHQAIDKDAAPPKGKAVFSLTGRVVPANVIRVSPKVEGEVIRVLVETGSAVKRGDLLAELDPRRYRVEADRSEAKLQAAHIHLQTAKSLRDKGMSSPQEVASRETEVRLAQADLELARLNLEGTRIVAPADGTILTCSVGVGSYVKAGGAGGVLCELADLRNLEAVASCPERDIGHVFLGQRCLIGLPGSERRYAGTVRRIDPSVDTSNGTVSVSVAIDRPQSGEALRPGALVHIDGLPKQN